MTQKFQKVFHLLLPESAYQRVRNHWHHFLRLRKEGFYTAYQRRRLWPKILDTPPVCTDPIVDGCETSVHLMCHQGDYLAAIWALKSFYYQAKTNYPLVIHVQGKSTEALTDRFRSHFPNAWLLEQSEADQIVEPFLSQGSSTKLLQLRRALPIMLKLTDIVATAKSRYVLILDSDILFFNSPTELTLLDKSRPYQALFQRDYLDAYVLTPERARAELGIDLQPQINTGIVIISPELVDLARCEAYANHPDFAKLSGHLEQTLYALEASRSHLVSYLPDSYAVSKGGKMACSTLKARHYAGPSRPLLTREGIPYLINSGFLDALQRNAACAKPDSPQLISDVHDTLPKSH